MGRSKQTQTTTKRNKFKTDKKTISIDKPKESSINKKKLLNPHSGREALACGQDPAGHEALACGSEPPIGSGSGRDPPIGSPAIGSPAIGSPAIGSAISKSAIRELLQQVLDIHNNLDEYENVNTTSEPKEFYAVLFDRVRVTFPQLRSTLDINKEGPDKGGVGGDHVMFSLLQDQGPTERFSVSDEVSIDKLAQQIYRIASTKGLQQLQTLVTLIGDEENNTDLGYIEDPSGTPLSLETEGGLQHPFEKLFWVTQGPRTQYGCPRTQYGEENVSLATTLYV
jgi:hypothetical protein